MFQKTDVTSGFQDGSGFRRRMHFHFTFLVNPSPVRSAEVAENIRLHEDDLDSRAFRLAWADAAISGRPLETCYPAIRERLRRQEPQAIETPGECH